MLDARGNAVVLLALVAGLVFAAGCLPRPVGPIATAEVPAPRGSPDRPLVIVLPGRGDGLWTLKRSGIAQAIQGGWPEADVLLAGVTFGYYKEGGVARRIHDELVEPARRRGYRQIWLAGASMGGTGCLLYERAYPGDAAGLVLFAPYMGGPKFVQEIADAGGPRGWTPPAPVPAEVGPDDYQPELWRTVKNWSDPKEARRVWLGCGEKDRFLPAAKLIAPLLPADHFVSPEGGHAWSTWDGAARAIFGRVAAAER